MVEFLILFSTGYFMTTYSSFVLKMTSFIISLSMEFMFDNGSCLNSCGLVVEGFNSNLIVLNMWVGLLLLTITPTPYVHNKSFYFLQVLIILLVNLFFLVDSMFLFFLFFELVLIPMMLLVFGWGYQPERLKAVSYLLIYAFLSSLPLALCLYYMQELVGVWSFTYNSKAGSYVQVSGWFLFGISFSMLVKMPLYGVHYWLPKVHVEAPTSGSMVLAGVFLKLGGFGLLRLIKPLVLLLDSFFLSWCLFGGLISSLVCMSMNDSKMLVAYSSVSHMAPVIVLLFTLGVYSLYGSLYMLIAHGFSSPGLFFMVGMFAYKQATRNLFMLKGLMSSNSIMSMSFFVFLGMNFALPPFFNLSAELLMGWGFVLLDFTAVLLFSMANFIVCLFSVYVFYKTGFSKASGLLFYNYMTVKEILVCWALGAPMLVLILFMNFMS